MGQNQRRGTEQGHLDTGDQGKGNEADDRMELERQGPPPMGTTVRTTSTSGPGGGGATEWSGRVKQHEGTHGGPSRKI